MPHLQQTRVGWENEHLAKFLLSRISFLAHPLTVADDLGVDLLCTLFEPKVVDQKIQLFPRQAFAIQIKTTFEPIDVSKKIEYLRGLELPYFVGFVDRTDSSVKIYSGELLPDFLSAAPAQFTLRLEPQAGPIVHQPQGPWTHNGANDYSLPIPLVGKLCVTDNDAHFDAIRQALLVQCSFMLRNIAAKISNEYIFQYPSVPHDYYRIIAGIGSVNHFRTNLMLRLAEAFYNLRFILRANPKASVLTEFVELEKSFLACRALGYPRIDVAQPLYDDLKAAIPSPPAPATAPPP